MAKKVIIGDREFKTKAEAKDFVRSIVAAYPDGATVDHGHFAFLSNLVSLHPEAAQKIGCGIAAFSVQVDELWGKTRGFRLHRTDGTSTDVSWVSCIDGKSVQSEALAALRWAVAEQVIQAKDAFLAAKCICPYRGIELTADNSHVDHEPPATFANLVAAWLGSHGITLEGVKVSAPADNQYVTEMVDEAQRASWAEYHRSHARLRLISKAANLSEVKRGL